MIVSLLFALQVASSPVQPLERTDDIVVTGKLEEGAKRALTSCIARQCPPNEEIKAAIVYATRQFMAGDYSGARDTLLESRRRNAGYATQFPVDVSNIHRALNTLSNLDGRPDSARISAFDATDALRAGLAPDDPLILIQRIDTAGQFSREGRLVAARQILEDVASKAHGKGYYGIEAQALFRGAAIYGLMASKNPDYRATAARWRKRIANRTEPEFAEYRKSLPALDAQVAALSSKADKRITAAVPVAGDDAVLLYEPDTQFSVEGERRLSSGGNTAPEWADVGFWVRPNGVIADVSVLQRSESPPGSWLTKKLQAVGARRYAPLKQPAGGPGIYRVERFSMVYEVVTVLESRVPVRSRRGRLETIDVTAAYKKPAV